MLDIEDIYVLNTIKSNYITKTYIKMKIEEYDRKRAIAKTEEINEMYSNYIDVLTELLLKEEQE